MSESDSKDILLSSYELSISVVFPQENPLSFGPNVSNSGLQCKKVKKFRIFWGCFYCCCKWCCCCCCCCCCFILLLARSIIAPLTEPVGDRISQPMGELALLFLRPIRSVIRDGWWPLQSFPLIDHFRLGLANDDSRSCETHFSPILAIPFDNKKANNFETLWNQISLSIQFFTLQVQ